MESSNLSGAGFTVHVLTGRLDAHTSDAVCQTLTGLVQTKQHLIVDCAELYYVSSVGLRVLLVVAKQAAALKLNFRLCALTENVKQVFELAGFTKVISLYPTREDALQAP